MICIEKIIYITFILWIFVFHAFLTKMTGMSDRGCDQFVSCDATDLDFHCSRVVIWSMRSRYISIRKWDKFFLEIFKYVIFMKSRNIKRCVVIDLDMNDSCYFHALCYVYIEIFFVSVCFLWSCIIQKYRFELMFFSEALLVSVLR